MQKNIIRFTLYILALAAVLYPSYVWYRSTSFESFSLVMLFPLFGIIAFTVMWLHVVGSALEQWIGHYVHFEKFVHLTSYLVLVSIMLHPLLLLIGFGFENLPMMLTSIYIQLAVAGFLLLITYDLGKIFKTRRFFIRHWGKIKLISTIGFFLIFFHSLGLGSNLQGGFLRTLWIFYGASAGVAAVYTYVIKKFLTRSGTN